MSVIFCHFCGFLEMCDIKSTNRWIEWISFYLSLLAAYFHFIVKRNRMTDNRLVLFEIAHNIKHTIILWTRFLKLKKKKSWSGTWYRDWFLFIEKWNAFFLVFFSYSNNLNSVTKTVFLLFVWMKKDKTEQLLK